MLPVGSVTEADMPPPVPRQESTAGCFSCGVLAHETEQCHVLDESFPFLRTESMMNSYYVRARGGLLARISDDYEVHSHQYEPQFPVVGEDLPWPAARDVSCFPSRSCPASGDCGSMDYGGR